MLRRLKMLILTLSVVASSGAILAPISIVSADALNRDACAGLNALNDGGTKANPTCDPSSGKSLNKVVGFAVNILSAIVGITAVIMLILAGLKFVTSNGESNNISSARNTILYALIGIAIVALAQVLVHFVLYRTTTAEQCANGTISVKDARCT